jgi:large subunit ribosomal protein L5
MTPKTHTSVKERQASAFAALKEKLGLRNAMETPRLVKVLLSTGVGSFKDKKKIEVVTDRLAKISGQKPSVRGAKKSIASYKTRIGDVVGVVTTLRGPRMLGFLEKFLNVALPRVKDFRGIPAAAIDEMGNVTVGVREHTIFPECSDEDLRDVFGFAVTVVTTARNKSDAKVFFEYLGFPFKKSGLKEETEPALKKKKTEKATNTKA